MQLSKAIEEVLLANGLSAGNSLHSWRCEYPDRYGHCTCVAVLAEEIAQLVEGANL
jgi:hypothetical protein